MRTGVARAIIIAAAGLWLAGCSTSSQMASQSNPEDANAAAADTDTTGSIGAPGETGSVEGRLLGSDPNDDLSLGKKHYRSNNFGLAERYFRRAVELHPRDGEAWVGLAASYDRLRRFDLADRAYAQAIKVIGPTVEILNNQGYSYMLRGDYKRAHKKLMEAQAKEPENQYVKNNIRLLAESYRKGKGID